MLPLLFEYSGFAFVACLGVIQIAVSLSGLRGLWLTPWPWANSTVGGALIIVGAWWFFASDARATPYPLLEGSQQGGAFLFAALAATWATIFLIPMLRRAWGRPALAPGAANRGLESFRAGSFWALRSRGRGRGG
ncbi:MAG: hypothetical protein EXR60_04225 [Dehalococcoidia bacterium]|nr:hypothetical protein [Dehalococcoidia bacterium]